MYLVEYCLRVCVLFMFINGVVMRFVWGGDSVIC